MSAFMRIALGALLGAAAAPVLAQAPSPPAAQPAGPIQRPFGSVPLMVPAKSEGPAKACDAACLTGLAQRYMDALVKQDGAGLPWAERVRYAENGVGLMIGDGTWATATAHGDAPLIVADAKAGKVVWIGSVDDHGQPGLYAIEMTVQAGRIASVATTIRRKEGRPPFGDPATFGRDLASPVKGKQTPRATMTALVEGFFGAQAGKGKAPAFAKGCALVENGVAMTGNLPAAKDESGDCVTSFSRGLFQEYEGVRHRVVGYDDARGLVVVSGRRDLPGDRTEFTAKDGKTYKAEADYPRSVDFISVFKIEGGAISRVETVATEVPYLMPAAWPEAKGTQP